jgi:hypothetical protein
VDRGRLTKLLYMVTGGVHPGEVFNAARIIAGMLREGGATWEQVIDGEDARVATEAARVLLEDNERLKSENQELQEALVRLRRPPLPTTWEMPATPGEQVAQAVGWTAILTDWEREFVTDMGGRWSPPTERQQAVLDRISNKIAGNARMRGLRP